MNTNTFERGSLVEFGPPSARRIGAVAPPGPTGITIVLVNWASVKDCNSFAVSR